MLKNIKLRGKQKIEEGFFLGDTSGKTKNLQEKSVFAISSKDREFTVKFESKEKQKIYRKLIQKNKKRGFEETKCLMHAVKIYYATKNFVENSPGFYICADGFIPRKLKRNLQELFNGDFVSKKFNFELSLKEMFCKHNLADRLAYRVNKKGQKPTFILKEKHFKKLGLL